MIGSASGAAYSVPSVPDSRRAIRALVRTASLLATVFLLASVFAAWRLSADLSWSWRIWRSLPVLCVLGAGSYLFRFARWHVLVTRIADRLPLLVSLRIYLAGFALGLTPARLGEFLKFALLRDATGIAEMRSAPIFPIERATEAASFLFLVVLGGSLGHFSIGHVNRGAIIATLLLPLLVAIVPVWRFLQQRLQARGSVVQRRSVHDLMHGVMAVAGLRPLTLALLFAITARCCDALLFQAATSALGLSIPLAGSALAYGLAGLVGGLSLLPAGAGAVEASLVTTTVALGGSAEAALGAALLCRLLNMWAWVPPGLYIAIRGVAASTRVPQTTVSATPYLPAEE